MSRIKSPFRFFVFLALLSSSFGVNAQFDHEPTLPNLEGQELRDALVDNFKTGTVLTYAQARDTFMRNMDAVNGQLECVYTGFTVTLSPNGDPTTEAFDQGINTEHTYPRSKGAAEGSNAYSDMHHLFPTKVNANSDRGSLIFIESPDNSTDRWYLDGDVRNSKPTSNIDAYSEWKSNEGFEPREKHKGDVARAYFYFYTMYRSQADNAAPNFFELQRETMCDWHFQDPVDEKEWNRNEMIATYQDDKRNPFILDCRLARLYCDDIEGYCTSVNTNEQSQKQIHSVPNPTRSYVHLNKPNGQPVTVDIINLMGVTVDAYTYGQDATEVILEVVDLPHGIYVVAMKDIDDNVIAVSKFIKI